MKKLVLVFAVFPVLAFACSEEKEGDRGDGPAEDFIASICDAYEPCCAEAVLPTDGAECRKVYREAFTTGDFGFDQAAADECSVWFESLSGTEFCEGFGTAPQACANVFTRQGDSAAGESCDSPGDCALSSEGDTLCLEVFGGQEICQLIIEGTEGSAPCAWNDRGNSSLSIDTTSSNFDEPRVYSCDAADGLYCDETACVPVITAGDPCVRSMQCTLGTYCGPEGLCTPQLPSGSPCQSYDECLEGSCTTTGCSDVDFGLAFLCGGSEE